MEVSDVWMMRVCCIAFDIDEVVCSGVVRVRLNTHGILCVLYVCMYVRTTIWTCTVDG